jgi:hypothetical protein
MREKKRWRAGMEQQIAGPTLWQKTENADCQHGPQCHLAIPRAGGCVVDLCFS